MTPPTRPLIPRHALPCAHCGKSYSAAVHEPMCPKRVTAEREQARADRDRARLWGIGNVRPDEEWGGGFDE